MFRSCPCGVGGGLSGGISSVGKVNATILNADNSKVYENSKALVRIAEAKEEVMEFVQYLKEPGKHEKHGAKIPKEALIYGLLKNGKTILTKSVA